MKPVTEILRLSEPIGYDEAYREFFRQTGFRRFTGRFKERNADHSDTRPFF